MLRIHRMCLPPCPLPSMAGQAATSTTPRISGWLWQGTRPIASRGSCSDSRVSSWRSFPHLPLGHHQRVSWSQKESSWNRHMRVRVGRGVRQERPTVPRAHLYSRPLPLSTGWRTVASGGQDMSRQLGRKPRWKGSVGQRQLSSPP